MFVGIYDFDGRRDGELSFKKGDLLYIISTDEVDWWFAQALTTGKEGYIPSNHVTKWRSLKDEE